jgi:RND family efflux transporter MFP subunit
MSTASIRSRFLKLIRPLFLNLGLCLLTASLGCAETMAKPSPNEPVVIATAKVSEQHMPILTEMAATLQAAERAAIAAKISGVVTRVPVVLGSVVKTGDVLVAISAEEITARLNQAEAQLAQARRNLEREQNLLAKNAATPEKVKSMVEQHAIAQAAHREARTMLGYATITAPFDGVVTRKNVNAGDLATPGTVLLQIEDGQRLQALTAVPESLMLRIAVGDRLTVRVPAAEVDVQGTVSEIAPAVDPNSRTAQVVLDLPFNPSLRTGQFARVLLPGKEIGTVMIPSEAVVPSGQMDRVFVVDNGVARLRLVRTGLRHGDLLEILAGLAPGDTVAVRGHRLLVDGQPVRVQP